MSVKSISMISIFMFFATLFLTSIVFSAHTTVFLECEKGAIIKDNDKRDARTCDDFSCGPKNVENSARFGELYVTGKCFDVKKNSDPVKVIPQERETSKMQTQRSYQIDREPSFENVENGRIFTDIECYECGLRSVDRYSNPQSAQPEKMENYMIRFVDGCIY